MKRLLLAFLLAPSVAHSAAITTPIFEYDRIEGEELHAEYTGVIVVTKTYINLRTYDILVAL